MSIEFNLQEDLQALSDDPALYQIPDELDVDNMSARELEDALDGAIEAVARDRGGAIVDPGTGCFDVYRSLLKHADHLNANLLNKLLDSITSGLQAEVDATTRDLDAALHANLTSNPIHQRPTADLEDQDDDEDDDGHEQEHDHATHKRPLEMFAFLLQWFVRAGEKLGSKGGGGAVAGDVIGVRSKKPTKRTTGKSTSAAAAKAASEREWIWVDHVPLVLNCMGKALKLRTERIWVTTGEREAFVSCFTRSAYQLVEAESHLKQPAIRLGFYKVICLAVKFHGHAFGAQTSVMQNLTYFEHLSEPMAEMLTILEKEFDHVQLTEEVLREVSGKRFGAGDQKGPRSFSRFLVKLAELSPRVVQKQMSLLMAHLDSEAHPMRMAIVEIIGFLIRDISLSEEGDEDQKKRQVKAFFELLFERYLDLNSWVRGKVIQTIVKLCDLPNKYPKQRHMIAELTVRSLEDKTSSVRKHSIQLLCKLLETHPFGAIHGGTLNIAEWTERYESLNGQLEVLEAQELQHAKQSSGMGDDDEEEGEEQDEVERERFIVKPEPEDDSAEVAEQAAATDSQRQPRSSRRRAAQTPVDPVDPQIIRTLRLTKKYYADALRFIQQLESAIPTLSQLLVSTNKAEALESMRFFRLAYEYNLQSAEIGIKTMLHLIWTKDNNNTSEDGGELKGIRANLIEIYRSLYFDVVPDLAPKQQVNRIAKNMIERTYDATLAELTSLEELMRTMMAEGNVHNDVINKLWQVYGTEQEIPKLQRRGAIIILGMLALAKRDIVTERTETLLKIGLGPHGKTDLVLARYTCVALQRLGGSAKKVKGSLADKTMRLPMENLIFEKLQQMVEHDVKSPQWTAMAEQALNTIYLLGEQPDVLCTDIIKNLSKRVLTSKPALDAPNSRSINGDEGEAGRQDDVESRASQPPPTPAKVAAQGQTSAQVASSFNLAQLIFVVGHVAIKHIVYLELVEREFKRRKEETAKAAEKAAEKDGNDLDAVAGNAEDDIGDLVSGIKEKELLYGPTSLLAAYGPMIAHICATPRVYKSAALRQSATLALTKLMCVSARFCEEHLQLLFKILETSKDPIVRSNIVIALGDIAVSFGSIIDENSEKLYEGLNDKDLIVKKNTLMVLTHLILNGMIKVKGQLGEMAKCLEDEEQRISDLAKLFFTELSTKDNALYNNLQDVISHLSFGKHAVDEETFETTMRFIFTFIEKEKQAESIVEKLCQRFRMASDERQWRDIAFCLSLLPYKSERSMKKLIEGLPFYQDKLHEETVFRRFMEILTKARSNKQSNKPETEMKEFEAILEEHRAQGTEDNALAADLAKKTAKAKKRGVVKSTASGAVGQKAKRGRPRAAAMEVDDEDEPSDTQLEEQEDDEEIPAAPLTRPTRASRKPTRKAVVEEEEEEGGEAEEGTEEEEVEEAREAREQREVVAKPKPRARGGRARRKVVDDDDEDE